MFHFMQGILSSRKWEEHKDLLLNKLETQIETKEDEIKNSEESLKIVVGFHFGKRPDATAHLKVITRSSLDSGY